jgi:hypothetical protein
VAVVVCGATEANEFGGDRIDGVVADRGRREVPERPAQVGVSADPLTDPPSA